MGNQAQQSQELELWQVVSSPAHTRGRQTRPGRSNAHTRSDIQRRGNVSDYRNTRTVRTARTGNTGSVRIVQTRNTGSAGTVRMGNAGSAKARRTRNAGSAGVRQTVNTGSAGARRMRNAGSAGARQTIKAEFASPVGTVRTRNAGSAGMIRTPGPGNRTRAQVSKKQKPGRRARISQFLAFGWIVAMSVAILFMGKIFYQSMQKSPVVKAEQSEKTSILENLPIVGNSEKKPAIREDFLTVSEYNRPGTKLTSVRNIFVHYTANPGTSAAQNRSYFENLGQTHERAASAHFIIGYEGEIIQCIPLDEEAYAVIERNGDSISIECCFLEEDGSFTQETYDSLIQMLAWLTDKYDLEPEDILRHYDCGGKLCPIYYVEHEDEWQKLLDDVAHYTL